MASAVKKKFTPEERISKAIIDLQRSQPFFADLAMGLTVKRMPEWSPMKTMGVDARGNLYYSDEFLERLSFEEAEGVVAHECLHVALSHISRIGARVPVVCNFAQDVVVNHLVLGSGLKLPEGGVPYDASKDVSEFEFFGPKKVRIEGVSKKPWEEIYNELMRFAKKEGLVKSISSYGAGVPGDSGSNSQSDGGGKGAPKGLMDYHAYGEAEAMSPEERAQAEGFWNERLVDAATRAKAKGNLPGNMERIIGELLAPKVRWRELLAKYVRQQVNPVDWSYSRPGRKSQALGIYLPTMVREVNDVEVVVDTSGSIGRDELTGFLSEVVGIVRSFSGVRLNVSFVDTKIQKRYEVVDNDVQKIVSTAPAGGGGTSMERGLKELAELHVQAPVVVVLTDGHDSWSAKASDFPFEVIWCISGGGIPESVAEAKIPYGLKVKLE